MRPTEIEAWALRVMDRVEQGNRNEDVRVELKAEWPDLQDMVRRVAGHANAAGPDSILWLIGVDEKGHSVPGVVARDSAEWCPSFISCFDEVAPRMTDLVVHRSGKIVTALLFETDRPPYVVRNPAFGGAGVKVQLEVPWRSGNAIRTARREDLLRVLLPQATLPECEVREVWSRDGGHDGRRALSEILIWLYVVPTVSQRAYMPFHRCAARLRTAGHAWVELESLHFTEDRGGLSGWDSTREPRQSHSIAASETELVIDGAGGAVLHGLHSLLVPTPTIVSGLDASMDFGAPLEIELTLSVARAYVPIRLNAMLEPAETRPFNAAARWIPRAVARSEDADASETSPGPPSSTP